MTARRTLLRSTLAVPAGAALTLSGSAPAAAAAAAPPGPFPGGQYLLMPLGDSITAGLTSDAANQGNGYRAYLRSWLRGPNECDIEMIGTQQSGTAGLYHEGHSGWTIGQLTDLVRGGLLAQTCPQFVTLLAGANDFGDRYSRTWDQAIADTSALLDLLLAAAPFVRVVLCEQILMSGSVSHDLTKNTWQQQRFNAALPELVARPEKQGRVVIAGSSVIGQDMLDPGGVHPNDAGYRWLAWSIYYALAPWLGHDVGGQRWMTNVPVPPGSPRPLYMLGG